MRFRAVSRKLSGVAAATLTAALLATPAAAAPGSAAEPQSPGLDPGHVKVLTAALAKITGAYQAGNTGFPADVLDYRVGQLWLHGIDGTGTTVAVLEGWNDPKINSVVSQFDQQYGLPDPQIQTIYPAGPLPAQCPPGMVALGSYGSCDAWAGELELDVVAVHLMAPYAKIIISATPADTEVTDDAASQVAMPELMRAIEYLGQHHLADAISISDGTGESTYSYGAAEIHAQDPGLLSAAAAGIPVMVATGDCGVVQNLAVANSQCGDTTPGPSTATWDDSPWAVAVGGSMPNLDRSGDRLGPDPVWRSKSGKFSPGAGLSAIYPRPSYQDGVAAVTGSDMRSVPDITMDARDGTSQAAPLFAGVLALAAQLNHGTIGPINQALYDLLGPRGAQAGIQDVVAGNNSVLAPDGTVLVPGYTAAPGFDVVSGWGTVDASVFVPALVAAVHARPVARDMQRQAGAELARLEHNIRLGSVFLPPGGSTSLTATGYLPTHPVGVDIDNHPVTTLIADTSGAVGYALDPARLGLAPGPHRITLHSMLLTSSAVFFTI